MKTTFYTIAGLLVAFLGGPLVLLVFNLLYPSGPFTNLFVILRELSLFAVALILILIVIRGEKSSLNSIGLNNNHWMRSILRAGVIYLLCIAAAILCILVLKWVGIKEGTALGRYDNVSLWVMSVVMLRAGVVEEICYRGYILERLEKISGKWVVYFLMPTLLFGLLHYTQGIRGMIIAFVLGMVLSYTYWKKRDLKANIIGHFLVDFISNIVVPLVSNA